MRPIDADTLIKEIKSDIMGGLNYEWYINEAPTIELCEDAISIEVAIQTTWMILNGMGYPKEQNKELEQTIKDVFATAPRVAPSRPKGEWIFDDKGYFSCSECGRKPKYQNATSDFCPNCGAKMKGADDAD